MLNKQAFVIIMVVCFILVISLIAWALINIGLSEILQTRQRNDLVTAFYVASAGAEKMYATLKTMSMVVWPQSISGSLSQDTVVGTFATSANAISAAEFCIVSDGTVNGRTTRVIVKYGYASDFTGGIPVGSIKEMSLTGSSQPAKLKIEGPAFSNSSIDLSGSAQVTNGLEPYQNTPIPTFWCDADLNPKTVFDTNGDDDYAHDLDGNGVVTLTEAQDQGKEAAFNADNAYLRDNGQPQQGDNDKYMINEKDAFYYYYTVELNNKYNLQVGPGQANYYSDNKSFEQGSVPNDVRVVFVDGDVTIDKNDQNWQGDTTLNHTVASTGNVNITQPTNRPGDVLAIVSYGDTYITGTMGNQGGVIGDLVVYSNNNILIENGGKSNSSIFAKGTLTIDTIGDDQGKDHRMINISTMDWTDSSKRPIGLPKDYGIISLVFTIENESTRKSIWQRN